MRSPTARAASSSRPQQSPYPAHRLGGDIDTVAGTGSAGYTGDDVPGGATAAKLNSPNCFLPIAPVDGGGFYVCDTLNNVIRRVDGAGTITTVAGTGAAGFVDGAALAAELDRPLDLAFDANGNLLIVRGGEQRHPPPRPRHGGRVHPRRHGRRSRSRRTAPRPRQARSRTPRAVTVRPQRSRRLRRGGLAPRPRHRCRGGNLVTLAGDGISSFGGDGGPALDAQLGEVMGVARDAAGRLLVSDNGNARVRRVDPCTGLIETIVGSGTRRVRRRRRARRERWHHALRHARGRRRQPDHRRHGQRPHPDRGRERA
jgi:hypothetical protein